MFRRLASTAAPPRRTSRRVIPRRCNPPPPVPGHTATPTATDAFNAPLYTIKAFSIATAIVVSTAVVSVAGVMAYLDVHDTAEFSARMRLWVSHTMPLLTAKIYRRPTSLDSVPDDPVLLAASSSLGNTTTATFDHDAAENRLAEAFDKGGLDAWTEAAAREMEAEIEAERCKKNTKT